MAAPKTSIPPRPMVLPLSGHPRSRTFLRQVVATCLLGLAVSAPAAPAGLESHPLAPRSTGPGPAMFTLLPPEQTGVVAANPYDDPAMWGARYREFSLGAIGTGVAIGDY